MRKALLILPMVIFLAACSENDKANGTNKTEKVEVADVTPKKEKNTVEQPKVNENIYFKDDVLKTSDGEIKLLSAKVIPGDPSAEYDFKKTGNILFEFEFTNLSDKPVSPASFFMENFKPTQETENTIEDLGVGFMNTPAEYTETKKTAHVDVKPNGVVKSNIQFELNYTDKPVILIGRDGYSDSNQLGKKTYEIN